MKQIALNEKWFTVIDTWLNLMVHLDLSKILYLGTPVLNNAYIG